VGRSGNPNFSGIFRKTSVKSTTLLGGTFSFGEEGGSGVLENRKCPGDLNFERPLTYSRKPRKIKKTCSFHVICTKVLVASEKSSFSKYWREYLCNPEGVAFELWSFEVNSLSKIKLIHPAVVDL